MPLTAPLWHATRLGRRLIMGALLLPVLASSQTVGDKALLDMRAAYSRGQSAELARLLPTVRGHVLEPLARYWDMRVRLDTASPTEIRAALDAMAGTYWEDRLRNDWLLQLGKRRDWARFEAERPLFRMNDDRQVTCYTVMLDAAGSRLPPEVAAERVRELWLAQRDAEDGCATAAQALLASGHLKPAVVWQRARAMMEVNRPRAASQAVALIDPERAAQIDGIAADPARYLDDKITAIRPRTKELVTLALLRLAAVDPNAAARELESLKWRTQLTAEERSHAWGAIGRRAAQRLQTDALDFYARGELQHMTDEHLAWMARAGLRLGRWTAVRDAIYAMSPAQRADSDWVYWRARAIEALQEPDAVVARAQARSLYESIASTSDFHGMLALETLGVPITTPPAPAPLTAEERRAAENDPGLRRALAAMRLGLRSEGVREWNYQVALHNTGGMADRELLAAADLACREQIWDRCINTSQRTRDLIDPAQRFPTPYREQVVARAQAIGLDPAYVYGLIRQESRFVTEARSSVGASGLMQVMPATARWTAQKIGLSDFRPHQINERDTNIQIGTAYLKFALDDFEGSMPLAAAAYNAGPGRARQWRNGPVLPGDIWAENIPFEETRDYVQRVLTNTTLYAAQLTGQPQSLRARLGTVGPRSATAGAVNAELP
ncbi:MAG: lytic transglycosylase domain-containing protein [Hydrogenophaga sp.]|nr:MULTISPECIES: lytic transglycosylase domain-containing protein [Hydrogenophaga]MBL0944745.1 lytic transglycosylase domain-containing protein [Hydrogenophaga sp.]